MDDTEKGQTRRIFFVVVVEIPYRPASRNDGDGMGGELGVGKESWLVTKGYIPR